MTINEKWNYNEKRGIGLRCLTPLSTMFQLYHGSLFYWWRKPEYPEKTTDLSQVTDKLYRAMLHRAHLTRAELKMRKLSYANERENIRFVFSTYLNVWVIGDKKHPQDCTTSSPIAMCEVDHPARKPRIH